MRRLNIRIKCLLISRELLPWHSKIMSILLKEPIKGVVLISIRIIIVAVGVHRQHNSLITKISYRLIILCKIKNTFSISRTQAHPQQMHQVNNSSLVKTSKDQISCISPRSMANTLNIITSKLSSNLTTRIYTINSKFIRCLHTKIKCIYLLRTT